jgi:hypothetical protein
VINSAEKLNLLTKRFVKTTLRRDHLRGTERPIERVRPGSRHGGWRIATGPLAHVKMPVLLSIVTRHDRAFDLAMFETYQAPVGGFLCATRSPRSRRRRKEIIAWRCVAYILGHPNDGGRT